MEKKSVFLEKFFFVEFAANADYDSAMLRVGLDCILDEVYIIVFVEYRDVFFESFVRLAEIFGTDKMYFIGEEEDFISDASEKYGSRGRVQAENLVRQISGLFAGGSLDEEDKDAVMRSIMDAYWESKNENSEKYSRKDKDGENK